MEHILTLKPLQSIHHCALACTCRGAWISISQDQRYLKNKDFCERILPSAQTLLDVECMNEFSVRCHDLFGVSAAVARHRCIACGYDRPVVEPLAITSSYSICPSCDDALQQELRNKGSRDTLFHTWPQCLHLTALHLTALGIRVLYIFFWWNLTAVKKPVQWIASVAKLIHQARCLEKEDLPLHR
eukprot:s1807_g8.t1